VAKAIIVYESKYGNTKLVAESILAGVKEVPGIDAISNELKEVDLNQIMECDAILLGSPNHMGGATRRIRKFIDKLGNLNLKEKLVAVFDTYLGGDFEKAAKKMEKQISKKAPRLKLAAPGLSIRVEGMKGPITEGELPKCKEFGAKIATQMKG
jgi:flavorubredoxin